MLRESPPPAGMTGAQSARPSPPREGGKNLGRSCLSAIGSVVLRRLSQNGPPPIPRGRRRDHPHVLAGVHAAGCGAPEPSSERAIDRHAVERAEGRGSITRARRIRRPARESGRWPANSDPFFRRVHSGLFPSGFEGAIRGVLLRSSRRRQSVWALVCDQRGSEPRYQRPKGVGGRRKQVNGQYVHQYLSSWSEKLPFVIRF